MIELENWDEVLREQIEISEWRRRRDAGRCIIALALAVVLSVMFWYCLLG